MTVFGHSNTLQYVNKIHAEPYLTQYTSASGGASPSAIEYNYVTTAGPPLLSDTYASPYPTTSAWVDNSSNLVPIDDLEGDCFDGSDCPYESPCRFFFQYFLTLQETTLAMWKNVSIAVNNLHHFGAEIRSETTCATLVVYTIGSTEPADRFRAIRRTNQSLHR